MPSMGDDFSLTRLFINFIDSSMNLVQLIANPDDVQARGLDVTFTVADDPLNMLDVPSVVFVWRHNEHPERQGSVVFEPVDAAVGRWKVYYPVEMELPGTVTATIEVTRDGRNFAMRLPTITVINEQLDFKSLPEGDTFGMFGAALLQLQKDNAEIEVAITEAKAAAQNANESAEQADSAAQRANEAADRLRILEGQVDDVLADAYDVAKDVRDSAQSAKDATAAANEAASAANEAAEKINDAADRISGAAEEAESAVEKANAAVQSAEEAVEKANAATTSAEAATEEAKSQADAARSAAERAESGEDERETQEASREEAELARAEAESGRKEAEQTRVSAEQSRTEAETERQQFYETTKAQVEAGDFNGATFTPAVSDEGELSWTNDKSLPNPETKNIRGPKGERGETGETGPEGPRGETGERGPEGPKGDKGDQGDGLRVLDTYDSLEALQEAHPDGGEPGDAYMAADHYYTWNGSEWKDCGALQGAKGEPGPEGPQGAPGKDGVSVTHKWDGTTLEVTSASGTSSADLVGPAGPAGPAGAAGPAGPPGENATTTELASEEAPGLLRQLSGKENEVLLGTGEWGAYRGGGGGSSGPLWLEVDEAGDLYAYYDDGSGAPNLDYDEDTGNLYAIFETEA